ncbi:hypothetical protein SAMN03159423_4823 [Bradyrhizobium sp. NFR13]|nr:hypothetical protein SAMN03159423_4823 [Bradyrhizobium sp. NFR13]
MEFGHAWGQSKEVAPLLPQEPLVAAVLLVSGHLLKVRGVTLYPADRLAEIVRLRELASTKLEGVSTGVGLVGSPGWAIGGGLALGLLERAMSSSARKEGVTILREAERKSLELAASGETFAIGTIANREHPSPNLWLAEKRIPRRIDYANLSLSEKSQFLLTYGKDKGDVVDGLVDVVDTMQFAHDGGEFVAVDTSAGTMKIRWQHVASYSVAPDTEKT